ncbi:MAG: 3-phosphoglycerate dehydrogenase [Ruminiclostridium sp.]|nr:3-phosphoglycerate dehydrogenase [Ruminiclostridium sp.]
MYNILTLNKIASCGTDLLPKDNYAISDSEANPDAVVVRSASMHEMELGSNLLAIARAGAGVNNIPIDKCSEQGIAVFNTPGANANAVKELVIAGLLLSSRKIVPSTEWIKTLKGKGDEVGKLVEKGKSQFVGPEISGKKLGVIGLGAIGALVANAALALGMEVYGADPFLSDAAKKRLSPDVRIVAGNDDIYKTCDYISIHAPATPETKGMINADNIAKMKDGVRILNFARADLVDSKAIIDALASGKMAAYATDFATDDLLCVENVIAIPHLGASTPESEDNCAVMACNEVKNYLEKGDVLNSVNLPNVAIEKTGDAKICVISKAADGIADKISAAAGITVANCASGTKKDMAYTVLDVKGDADAARAKIEAVDGVIKVRVIK